MGTYTKKIYKSITIRQIKTKFFLKTFFIKLNLKLCKKIPFIP